MELATGGERTIDGIADGERVVLGHPKTREAMRAGLAMYFVTLDDPELMEIADQIVDELAIEHFFNIQLVGEHVIEINPRISTIVYQDDLNLPYLGVKRALGEISDDELVGAALADPAGPGEPALLRPGRLRRPGRRLPRARASAVNRGRCRVTLCPVNTRRRAVDEREALARAGVDARLVVFKRYQLHPEADWSLDAPAGCCPSAGDGSGRRSRGCCRAPTSSTSTSGSRSCRSGSSSRSCARRGRSRSSTTSARTSAARRPSSSPTASGPTPRSSAATTRSAGCPRRR